MRIELIEYALNDYNIDEFVTENRGHISSNKTEWMNKLTF